MQRRATYLLEGSSSSRLIMLLLLLLLLLLFLGERVTHSEPVRLYQSDSQRQ